MEAGQQRLEAKMDRLLFTVDFLSSRVDQMQAQMHLNSKAVDQVVHDQQMFAAQLDATGKAVAGLTLERMAKDLEESADTLSQVSARSGYPRHPSPTEGSPDPPIRHHGKGRGGGAERFSDGHRHGEPPPHRSTFGRNRFPEDTGEFARYTLPKMTFPRFDGEHPKIWVD